MRFELARPSFEEAEVVWKWRLDPVVMKNSLSITKPISLEEFFSFWVSTYFTLPELPPLYPLVDKERVGVVRFNRAPGFKSTEISILLTPEARGKGLAAPILRSAAEWVRQQQFCTIVAKIKPENIASIKAFEAAGYRKVKEGESSLEYRLELRPEPSSSVFVIAEIGSNWTQADPYLLIDKAAEAGANAVKFQVFRAETTYVKGAGVAGYLDRDVEALFKELEMPYEKIGQLAESAKKAGLEFMATPFSLADFEAIDPFVKRHKIASYENHHPDLLKAVARTQKPVILSTGATTLEEVAWSFDHLKLWGAQDITLLQCLAKYPAPPEEMNLRVLKALQEQFHTPVGLSDHTQEPFLAPLTAVALGATVIEKHYTLDRALPGPDHSFAITPEELKELVKRIRQTEKLLGSPYKKVEPSEQELREFARRGVQAILPIKKGEPLVRGVNIEVLRPGKQKKGADPSFLESLESSPAAKDYEVGEGVFL